MTFGVGIVGAGPVTQAIHIPTLARMPELFAVVNVMDVSREVATTVAARVGARVSTTVEELLADAEVDIVVICSPPQFHAAQVVAAMEAGKKAVLCEKPLATTAEEAREISEAAERTRVPVIVGAMHVFDPGWQVVQRTFADFIEQVHTVRSRIVLPFNDRFEDWATEILNRPAMSFDAHDVDPATAAQAMLNGAILGLAVHDLPLVRALLPDGGELRVQSARTVAPFGYLVSAQVAERSLELVGCMYGGWEAYWELEAVSEDARLSLRFPPSYVHGGSAVATMHHADGRAEVFGPYPHNGYENEWRALYAVVTDDATAAPPAASLLADLSFILDIADKSAEAVAKEFAS